MWRPGTFERYRETSIATAVQIQRFFSLPSEAEREKGVSQHPNIPRHVTVSFLLHPLFPPTLPCVPRLSQRINDQSHPATFISRNRPRAPRKPKLAVSLSSFSFRLVASLRCFLVGETKRFIARRKLRFVRIRLLIERKLYPRLFKLGAIPLRLFANVGGMIGRDQ